MSAPAAAVPACATCGAPVPERFCGRCGERRLAADELRLRRFVGEGLEAVLNVDGRALRTVRALVARPGELTAAYVAGRRTPYLAPMQLFLACNVVFFLVQAVTQLNTLSTPLAVQLDAMPYRELLHPLVRARLEAGASPAALAARFDAAAGHLAASLVVLMVPGLAAASAALDRRPRRGFVAHLAFATHVYAWWLLLLTAIGLAAAGMAAAGGPLRALVVEDDALPTLVLVTASAAYLAAALRPFSGGSRLSRAARALALTAAMLVLLQLHRFVLFFVTWLTM